jgi:uncharacterized protein (TIGR01777 family)
MTGATGLVGKALVRALRSRGDQPVVLSRNLAQARKALGPEAEIYEGDPRQEGNWMQALAGCEGVVNLAGEPIVGRRWNADLKRSIVASRVDTTRTIAQAIQAAAPPPRVFISASAIGYYGPHPWEKVLEETDPPGRDFLAGVCVQWEAAADLGEMEGAVRKVILRIGVVLDKSGGALGKMLTPFKLGLGGPAGSGHQPFSWIHVEDLVAMILWALGNSDAKGTLNAVAPQPVTNKDFARTLGRVLRRPAFIPTPAFALRAAFGDGAEILLTGQRVVPERAMGLGFALKFPEIEGALRDLLD